MIIVIKYRVRELTFFVKSSLLCLFDLRTENSDKRGENCEENCKEENCEEESYICN